MNKPHLKPYIGITGFMSSFETFNISKNIPKDENIPKIMFGILVNERSLNGLPVSEKYSSKYPTRDTISTLFSNHKNIMNTIHFNTDDPDHLFDQLLKMVYLYSYGNHQIKGSIIGRLGAFQLNIVWPDIKQITEFRELMTKENKEIKLILQIGNKALDQAGNSPKNLIRKLKDYENVIDYVLLDSSGGNGRLLNVNAIYDYTDAIYNSSLKLNTSIAGGLCAESLDKIESIIESFPEVSIDTEGKLRNKNNKLDLNLTIDYLEKALSIYKKTIPVS